MWKSVASCVHNIKFLHYLCREKWLTLWEGEGLLSFCLCKLLISESSAGKKEEQELMERQSIETVLKHTRANKTLLLMLNYFINVDRKLLNIVDLK